MSWLEIITVCLSGLLAGGINAVVGSGSLLTFPSLVAIGIPPITANMSNTIGLILGGVSGTWGYRRELKGQAPQIRWLLPAAVIGSACGAGLLLVLPSSFFDAAVPILIAGAVLLVIISPRLTSRARRTHIADEVPFPAHRRIPRRRPKHFPRRHSHVFSLYGLLTGTAVYGGYFGAAFGVLLIATLDLSLSDTLQRINALKNLLATTINGVASIVFVFVASDRVHWTIVALLAVGTFIGGLLGARLGRLLPARAFRGLIVAVGVVAVVRLITT
ncbi:MAG: sulfite exporter TauE/SafE family protein [Actinomycetota bacterium]